MRFEYLTGLTPDTTYDVSTGLFKAVSSSGKDYDSITVVEPAPSIEAKLYPGASNEGWVAFQVAQDDAKPLMTLGRKYDGTGGIWFMLYSDSAQTTVPTPTPTLTPTPSPTPTPTPTPLTGKAALSQYLITNFSKCQTSLGTTSFTFYIDENKAITMPYDYWIQVEYDFNFFYDLRYSNNITTEMNLKVCQELQDYQEKLARAVIAFMPDKKFYGGYYYSWYEYPTLKAGLKSRQYYTWVNYQPASFSGTYEAAKLSSFQWYQLIDDKLTR